MVGRIATNFLLFFALVGLALNSFTRQLEAVEATCFGPKNAPFVVYLHGLDDRQPTKQEQENQQTLKTLAESLKFRLAIMRSESICRKSKLCWPHQSLAELQKHFNKIKEKATLCSKKKMHFIGFSNGGYFASKIAQNCFERVGWVVAIGSAGKVFKNKPKKDCPAIHLLIGAKDITRPKTKKYHQALKKHFFQTTFKEFKGAHEIKKKELRELLKSLMH